MASTSLRRPEQDRLHSTEGEPRQFSYSRASWDTDEDSLVPATKEALGGKALSLLVMTKLGIPIPPEFTLSTDVGRAYLSENALPKPVAEELTTRVGQLEKITKERFGDPEHPLFVSVRSGAETSMPGAMKTILNIGLNKNTIHALAKEIGENAAWIAYYHFVKQFAEDICHVDMSVIEKLKDTAKEALGFARINELPLFMIKSFLEITKARVKYMCQEFPQDPHEQLRLATNAVFESWNSPEAIAYRRRFGISEYLGTAVTVQRMVWGNSQWEGSGSGVVLSRDPQTLDKEPVVGWLPHVQGNAPVGDSPHRQMSIDDLPISDAGKQEIRRWIQDLESYYQFPRDFEFTIQVDAEGHEHRWGLQDRREPLTNPAYVLWLLEQIKDAKMSEKTAMRLATAGILYSVLDYDLDPKAMEKARLRDLVTTGQRITNGHATGVVVFSIEEAKKQPRLDVVLMAPKNTKIDLLKLPQNVAGVFTHGGGIGAHSGRIGARMNRPIIFDGRLHQSLQKGDVVTINGTTGEVFRGIIPLAEIPGSSLLTADALEIAKSWDVQRRQNPWQLLVTPEDEWKISDIAETATQKLTSLEEYQSRKAKIEAAFIQVIPRDIRMEYDIKQADDVVGIKSRVKEILRSGGDATLRTAHFPDVDGGKGPWAVFTSEEDIDEFFANPFYTKSKYGGYHAWRGNAALTEIFVGHIPKDKLSEIPEIKFQHCAWTASCSSNNEFIIQIHPHGPHLRELDEKDADTFITYNIPVDTKSGQLVETVIPKIGEKLMDDESAIEQARFVVRTIRDWYAKYQLAERLAALAVLFPHKENYSSPALQGQTRIDPNGQSWIYSYDLNIDHFDKKVEEQEN